jgi:hypothetical protein
LSHFSADRWFDFARGTLVPEDRVRMQDHLDGECDRCLKTLQTWQTVLETVRREEAYRPSASAVQYVKARFASSSTRWTWLAQMAKMARLAFDSSLHLAAAPVRGSMPSSRQFIYKAEPFVIDVAVEFDPTTNRVWLIGQVLNSKKPDMKIEHADVVLLSGERLVAKTTTDPAGEFEFEFGDERGLRLFINIGRRRAVGISIPDCKN